MSTMASTTSSMKGFSVLQPSLGAPLSWMPALGSKELAQLIDAYLPGPASAQDKRAAIATDFFKFAAETGENFKYYSVNMAKATPSPASSAFNTSPAMSNMSYGSPSQPSTPAPRTSFSSATKSEKTDYSHLPGMKILTTDGQDVTNSLSRGCKSKEQREHAHLMRVLKACDACKKKKIRCDPSHKRRTSAQVSPKTATKPTRKAKKSASASAAATQAALAPSTSAAFTPVPELSFDFDMDLDMDFGASLEGLSSIDMDGLFDFNQAASNVHQDFYGAMPAQNFDFYLGNDSLYSPAMTGSTTSFNSPAQPLTPTSSGLLPQGDFIAFSDTRVQAFVQTGDQQQPSLPYMTPGPHGSDYTDFNLYSPSSSFIDEEPVKLKAGSKRKNAARSAESPGTELQSSNSSPSLSEARSSTGLADDHQWGFDYTGHGTVNPQMLQSRTIPGDDQVQQQQRAVVGELVGGVVGHGQRPYHGDDGGHDSMVKAATTTRLRGSQQQSVSRTSPTPLTPLMTQPEGREKHSDLPAGNVKPVPSISPTGSSSGVSPRNNTHLEALPLDGGARMHQRTVSPSELRTEESSCRLNSLPQAPIARQSPAAPVSLATLSHTGLSSEGRESGRLLARGLAAVSGGLLVGSGMPGDERLVVKPARAALSSTVVSSRGGLVPTEGLSSLVSAAGLHSSAAATTNAVAATAAAGITTTTPVNSLRPTAAFKLASSETTIRETIIAGAVTISSPDLGLLVPSQQRQALHSKPAPALAASSSSSRCPVFGIKDTDTVVDTTLLPVRQTLGQHASSLPLTHLAVLGLVSMLLIVGFTWLLQQSLQLPSSSSFSPLFAYLQLPSSSSSLVILSLLTTHSPLSTAKSIPGGVTSSSRRQGRHHHLGRVPVACC